MHVLLLPSFGIQITDFDFHDAIFNSNSLGSIDIVNFYLPYKRISSLFSISPKHYGLLLWSCLGWNDALCSARLVLPSSNSDKDIHEFILREVRFPMERTVFLKERKNRIWKGISRKVAQRFHSILVKTHLSWLLVTNIPARISVDLTVRY